MEFWLLKCHLSRPELSSMEDVWQKTWESDWRIFVLAVIFSCFHISSKLEVIFDNPLIQEWLDAEQLLYYAGNTCWKPLWAFFDIRRLVISQNIREKYKNKCRLVKTHSKPNRPTRSNPACILLFSCSGKSSGTAGLCYLHFLGDPLHASWQSHDAFFEMKDQLSLWG